MHTEKPVNHFLQNRASADRRSQFAPTVKKLRHKPVNAL